MRHLEGGTGHGLAPDVGEVRAGRRSAGALRAVRQGPRRLTPERLDEVAQVADADHGCDGPDVVLPLCAMATRLPASGIPGPLVPGGAGGFGGSWAGGGGASRAAYSRPGAAM